MDTVCEVIMKCEQWTEFIQPVNDRNDATAMNSFYA